MMRRRQLLAATTSTALLPLAGCLNGLSGPADLGPPEEELDANGQKKHLIFARDSERQAVITIYQRMRPESLDQRVPFRLHVWHRDGLTTDQISIKLRAPPTTTGVPANVYLQVPDGGPWPAFDLRKNDNQWTVIDIDEIGRLGDGSLGLDLILDPVSDPVKELAVRTEVAFSESGMIDRNYQATANTEFDVLSTPS